MSLFMQLLVFLFSVLSLFSLCLYFVYVVIFHFCKLYNLCLILNLKLLVDFFLWWVLFILHFLIFFAITLCFVEMTFWKAMITIHWVYWNFCLSFWLFSWRFVTLGMNSLKRWFSENFCCQKGSSVLKLWMINKNVFGFKFYFFLKQFFKSFLFNRMSRFIECSFLDIFKMIFDRLAEKIIWSMRVFKGIISFFLLNNRKSQIVIILSLTIGKLLILRFLVKIFTIFSWHSEKFDYKQRTK